MCDFGRERWVGIKHKRLGNLGIILGMSECKRPYIVEHGAGIL